MQKERFFEGVNQWVETGHLDEQDWILEQELRYSPQMLRYAGYSIARNAAFAEPIKNLALGKSIAFYLYFIGAIEGDEYGSFFARISEGKFPEVNDKQLLRPDSIQLRNAVRSSIEDVAEDVEKIRATDDNVIVVLNHGKYNTFPHIGYMFTYLDVMEQLDKMGHWESKVIFVVANETNKYIRAAGDTPFLNTAWRVSANSYMPYDFVCPAEEHGLDEEFYYWTSEYSILKPEYVVINPEDRSADKQREQVKRAGKGIGIIESESVMVLDTDDNGEVLRERRVNTSSLGDFDQADVLTLIRLIDYLLEEEISWGNFNRKVDWSNYLRNLRNGYFPF